MRKQLKSLLPFLEQRSTGSNKNKVDLKTFKRMNSKANLGFIANGLSEFFALKAKVHMMKERSGKFVKMDENSMKLDLQKKKGRGKLAAFEAQMNSRFPDITGKAYTSKWL